MFQLEMIRSWFIRLIFYVYKFLYTQLFITIVTLPIIIAWGLPFSFMSPISNFFFTPFLSIFLLFSSLIFFSTILHIPNGFLVRLTDWYSVWLYKLLEQGSFSWLVAINKPHFVFLVIIAFSAFCIVHAKKISFKRVVHFLCICLIGTIILFKATNFSNNKLVYSLVCNHKSQSVAVVRDNNQIALIDPGYLCSNGSLEDWIEYKLLVWLNQMFGCSEIDHLIVLKPTKRVLAAIKLLCLHTRVKNIYFPYWSGQAEEAFLKSYGSCMYTCKKHGVVVRRIGNKPIEITMDQVFIYINPLEKIEITYGTMAFRAAEVVIKKINDEIEKIMSVSCQKSCSLNK